MLFKLTLCTYPLLAPLISSNLSTFPFHFFYLAIFIWKFCISEFYHHFAKHHLVYQIVCCFVECHVTCLIRPVASSFLPQTANVYFNFIFSIIIIFMIMILFLSSFPNFWNWAKNVFALHILINLDRRSVWRYTFTCIYLYIK